MPTNAVATTAVPKPATTGGKRTIKGLLEGETFKLAVAQALPKHLKPERFIRIAITALQRTPKLAQCTEASFFKCLLDLSAFGLEPDGRRAHLIPFENRNAGTVECTLIVDWKGLAELAMRSGVISYLHADVVRFGDIIDYSAGELRSHIPHFLRFDKDRPEDEGEIFAVYAIARLKDGATQCVILSKKEVEAIRKRSRSGGSGPWQTDWNEMAKKTVFRRLSKWLPLTAEARDAVEADDDVIDIPGKDAAEDIPLTFAQPAALPEHNPEDDVPMSYPTAEAVPVQTTAEKVAPAPKKQAKPSQAAVETTADYLSIILGLISKAGSSEAKLLQFLRDNGTIDESLSSLREVEIVRPTVLEHVYGKWSDIAPHIGGAK